MKVSSTLLIGLASILREASAKYDFSPVVDMSEYESNFRVLDCFECFSARGKFCHDKEYDSMFEMTRSSNEGHGICCKSDYSG